MSSLEGGVSVVIGGGSGIGLGIATALAAEGCRVVLAGRTEGALGEAAGAIGEKAFARVCDATDRASVRSLFDWTESEVGPIDILVNSAGMNVPNRAFANLDPEDFDRVLTANLTATFNAMHAALPKMRERKSGQIFNVVSLAGLRSMQLAGVPYVTSKFGQGALGLIANQEANDDGVRVTNVYPGETNTPIVDKRPSPPPEEKRAAMLQPEDVAAMVVAVAKLDRRAVVPEIVITPRHMPLS